MGRIRIHKSSPAVVLAGLALLVALGGTAYATAMLPPNSVGTKQIKNAAVTLPKISSSAQQALRGQRGLRGAMGVKGNPATRLWAKVAADGTLLARSGIVGTVSHSSSSGIYDLTLSHDGTNCAAVATLTDFGGSQSGGIAQAGISGTDLEVHTQYYNGTNFQLADSDFAVAVFC